MKILIEGTITQFLFRTLKTIFAEQGWQITMLSKEFPETDYDVCDARIVLPSHKSHSFKKRDIPTMAYDRDAILNWPTKAIYLKQQVPIFSSVIDDSETVKQLLIPYALYHLRPAVRYSEYGIVYIPPGKHVIGNISSGMTNFIGRGEVDIILDYDVDTEMLYKTYPMTTDDRIITLQYIMSSGTVHIDSMQNEAFGVVSERWIQAANARCGALISHEHTVMTQDSNPLAPFHTGNIDTFKNSHSYRVSAMEAMHEFLAEKAQPKEWINAIRKVIQGRHL